MDNQIGRIALACAMLAASALALAADGVETRQLQFARGASSLTVKGAIQGDQTIDYQLRAAAGQTLRVAMETSNRSNYFNVLPPGSADVAIFVGSSGGDHWHGVVDAAGDYKVRVYLMRNAARRHETASYTLTVGLSGRSRAGMGAAPARDARVAGTRYHATGTLPCSVGDAAKGAAQCAFGVIRGKPGNAEVHVTRAGGGERVLHFAGDQVSSDGDSKVKARKQGDAWTVDVNGNEHYQVPEAAISGG